VDVLGPLSCVPCRRGGPGRLLAQGRSGRGLWVRSRLLRQPHLFGVHRDVHRRFPTLTSLRIGDNGLPRSAGRVPLCLRRDADRRVSCELLRAPRLGRLGSRRSDLLLRLRPPLQHALLVRRAGRQLRLQRSHRPQAKSGSLQCAKVYSLGGSSSFCCTPTASCFAADLFGCGDAGQSFACTGNATPDQYGLKCGGGDFQDAGAMGTYCCETD
jgi:hypothetical protein